MATTETDEKYLRDYHVYYEERLLGSIVLTRDEAAQVEEAGGRLRLVAL